MLRVLLATTAAAASLIALPASSQQVASAPNAIPVQRHLVFLEQGDRLPVSAAATLREAALVAKRSPVIVEGRPAQAAEVRDELVRMGAPQEAIIVRPEALPSVPSTSDGLPNPAQRRVAISF